MSFKYAKKYLCLYDLWFVPINVSSNGNTFSIIFSLEADIPVSSSNSLNAQSKSFSL